MMRERLLVWIAGVAFGLTCGLVVGTGLLVWAPGWMQRYGAAWQRAVEHVVTIERQLESVRPPRLAPTP